MAGEDATRFLNAIKAEKPYIPIPLASIRFQTVTGFELYFQSGPGQPHVLYAMGNVRFSEEHAQRLEEHGATDLFISSKQRGRYQRYLELNLQDILNDPAVPGEEKAEILHVTAQGLIQNIIENQDMEDSLDRAQDVVGNTVNFLYSDASATHDLIRTASYDYDLFSHSVNGCVFGVALADRFGIRSPDLLREFGTGLFLRDVGMSQLDPSIQNAQESLSLTQFEIFKQHPILGEELVRSQGDATSLVLDVIRHHHEKLSGRGYPDGLKGQEIRPLVRIAAVVETFDTLTTNKGGRRGKSTFAALKELGTELKEDYDQDVVRTFIEMMGGMG